MTLAYDDTYDSGGNLVSSVPRTVSDAQQQHDQAQNNVDSSHDTLVQWATDAATDVAGWGMLSVLAKDDAEKRTIQRFGLLCQLLADLLLVTNQSEPG